MKNFLPESLDSDDLPLLTELQRRRMCRSSLLAWCEEALAPFGQAPAAHHRLLIEELEKVVRGETRRLMVNMPPGSALMGLCCSPHGRSRSGMALTSKQWIRSIRMRLRCRRVQWLQRCAISPKNTSCRLA